MEHIYVKWKAKEHEKKNHGPDWFWGVGVLALALAIGSLIIGNTLLALLIVIGTVALILQTIKKPAIASFAIGDEGVSVNKTLYKYQDLDSFGLTNEHLLLKSKKKLMPFITIPLPSKHKRDAREALSAYLPEEEHTEPVADKIMEGLGF